MFRGAEGPSENEFGICNQKKRYAYNHCRKVFVFLERGRESDSKHLNINTDNCLNGNINRLHFNSCFEGEMCLRVCVRVGTYLRLKIKQKNSNYHLV